MWATDGGWPEYFRRGEIGQAASEYLFSRLKDWGHCHLLIDRELSDPFHEEFRRLQNDKRAFTINPKAAYLPPESCLILTRISTQELELIERSTQISVKQNTDARNRIRAVGGWIFSENATTERIARHLERAIIVRSYPNRSALLRIWDPRVLCHLSRILNQDQLASLFGPIKHWAWIDRDGEFRHVDFPALTDSKRFSTQLPLRLTTDQDAAIDRIEELNILLKALANLGHRIECSRDIQLDSLILMAQRKGYVIREDTLAFCLHSLLVSKSFYEIPEVSQAITHYQLNGLGLCAALEQFSDDFWVPHKDEVLATQPHTFRDL